MSTGKKRLLAYAGMIIALSISGKLIKDIVRLSHIDDRVIEVEEELVRAEKEQKELKKRLEKAEEGEWREEQVRNTLKMAKSNEVVVIVPEQVIKTSGDEKVVGEEEVVSNWQKWWNLFYY